MRKRKVAILLLIIVLIALLFVVSLQLKFKSPLTMRPKIVIDYDYADNYTKIYVVGGEVRRYTRMEIRLNQSLVVNETNVYLVWNKTNLTEFSFVVTVVDDTIIYRYECGIKIVAEEEIAIIITENNVPTKLKKSDLPKIIIMVEE